jgi:hypothetical protein
MKKQDSLVNNGRYLMLYTPLVQGILVTAMCEMDLLDAPFDSHSSHNRFLSLSPSLSRTVNNR